MIDSERTRRTIVVGGVPEHFNLPWKLAIESGAFTDAGLDVRWVDEPAGTGAIIEALAEGHLDLATVLTEGLVAALDRGLAAHVERLYVRSPLWWGIHVPRGSAAVAVGKLAHRRIAISRLGSGSHLMAFVLAAREGWSIGSENFIIVGGLRGGVDALAEDRADIFLWETFMTKPSVDEGRIARAGEIATPWPAFVVARRKGFGAARSLAVLRIVDASVTSFVNDPATPRLIADRLGIDESDAIAWLARTQFAHGDRLTAPAIQQVREQLRAAGATT